MRPFRNFSICEVDSPLWLEWQSLKTATAGASFCLSLSKSDGEFPCDAASDVARICGKIRNLLSAFFASAAAVAAADTNRKEDGRAGRLPRSFLLEEEERERDWVFIIKDEICEIRRRLEKCPALRQPKLLMSFPG